MDKRNVPFLREFFIASATPRRAPRPLCPVPRLKCRLENQPVNLLVVTSARVSAKGRGRFHDGNVAIHHGAKPARRHITLQNEGSYPQTLTTSTHGIYLALFDKVCSPVAAPPGLSRLHRNPSNPQSQTTLKQTYFHADGSWGSNGNHQSTTASSPLL